MSTGYLYDERFLKHDTGTSLQPLPPDRPLEPVEHPSSARITRRTNALVAGSELYPKLVPLEARPATEDELAYYHTRDHIDRIRKLAESGGGQAGRDGEDAPMSSESWEAALLAAGSAIAAVDAVLNGTVRNAFALIRPPGHHAMADEAMGFCLFNNVVIAARHAQRVHGLRRVMILDWDVHHGNGTQAAFYEDPDVLFISFHQDDWYPAGWGTVDQVGEGAGEGRTVNVPLPAGTGTQGYLDAMRRVVLPIARQFRPELILISAGQDPSMVDPLGRMMVNAEGFRLMAEMMRDLAEKVCDGRLVAIQEGGYSPEYVPYCILRVIEGMTGERTAIPDSQGNTPELQKAFTDYHPWQREAVDAVIKEQSKYWELEV
jgi:acetoin utilization deacetylase AcuC-like enzyme